MFCNKCGREIDKTDAFCRSCGNKIRPIINDPVEHKVRNNAIVCPQCGGSLNPINGLDTYMCPHCGNKVFMSGMSKAAYDARVNLKKIEQEERLENKKLSHEKDLVKIQTDYTRKANTKKGILISLGLIIPTLILLIVFVIYPDHKKKQLQKQVTNLAEEVESYLEDEEYNKAEKANNLLKQKVMELSKDDWITWMDVYLGNAYEITLGKREQSGEKPKKVTLKADLEEIDDMDKNDVVDYLIKQGFVNISCASRKAKIYQDHYYEVDDITIEGEDDYSAGEVFYDDDEVIILILVPKS